MKLLTCDDHDLFRAGLRQVLEDVDPTATLLEADRGEEALRLVEEHPDLDLLLLDLGLPDTDGMALLHEIRQRHPAIGVAIVSGSEEPALVRETLEAGAMGFIPKSSKRPVLKQALSLIFAGGVYVPPLALEQDEAPKRESRRPRRTGVLTDRQLAVVELMRKGLTNREIGDALGISAGTVKVHVAAILEALDVTNRTEAVTAVEELGLLGAD